MTVSDTIGPAFSGCPGGPSGRGQRSGLAPSSTTSRRRRPTRATARSPSRALPHQATTFPLGTTTVTCTSADSHGNPSTASFGVRVVDTTKPSLSSRRPLVVYADTPDGFQRQIRLSRKFLGQAQAVDSVDPSPRVSNDAPAVFPWASTSSRSSQPDASGNTTSEGRDDRGASQCRLRDAAAAAPPAQTIPKDVTALKAEAGDGQVRLSWQLPNGVDHVVVTHQLSAGGDIAGRLHGLRRVVHRSRARQWARIPLSGRLRRQDRATRPPASPSSPLPKATLLRSPKDGARLKKPPKLVWVRNAEAAYYNVQLFRGTAKILSTWPRRRRRSA